MDFRQLESFIAIVKHKSFSKAAKELYLTQPTISNHMQNLEKELKTTLINRNNKQVELTKAGEIFYDYAVDILNLKDKVQFNLGSYTGKIEGTIDIYCSTIPQQYLLPKLLKNFQQKFPEIRYRMNHLDSFDIITAILENEINYGFTGSYIKDSNLEYFPLMKDELVLITPNDFEHNQESVSFEVLKQLPMILREEGSGTRDLLAVELKRKKIDMKDLNIIVYSKHLGVIKTLVEEGLGCTVMSKIAIEKELVLKSLKAYPIKDLNLSRNFYLAVAKNRVLSPLESNFVDYIRSDFSFHEKTSSLK